MNKKIAIVTAIAAVGTIGCIVSMLGSEGALMERFPDINPKIVVKVHRKIIRDTLMGRLPNDLTEAQLDELFLERAFELASK